MRVYYDTEFLEDGRTIELISIGMVAEDGREFYAVSEEIADDPLYGRICARQWLMENVVPHLPLRGGEGEKGHGRLDTSSRSTASFDLDRTSGVVMSRDLIREAVRDFLWATPAVELWAWFGAYDHVVLAQLFGRMIDFPQRVPMWTNDVRQEQHRLGNPPLPVQPAGLHNALADARHLQVMHRHLTTWEQARAAVGEKSATTGGSRPRP